MTKNAISWPAKARSLLLLAWLVGLGAVGGGPVEAQTNPGPSGEKFITDSRVRQDEGFLEVQIQQFLDAQPGPLKTYSETPYFGSVQSAARSLALYSQAAEINPRVVLALLELKSRLLSDLQPSPDRLALGLGFDRAEQRGFRNQLQVATTLLSQKWAAFEVQNTLQFKDGSQQPAAGGLNRGTFAVQAILAATTSDRAEWLRQIGSGPGSFYAVYKKLFGDPLDPGGPASPAPAPAEAATGAPVPFLRRPFEEKDLMGPGIVTGRGKRFAPLNPGYTRAASDDLDYNHPADYGINTYFDHQYPSDISGQEGNPPDNEAPDTVVTYRGRASPGSWGEERAYSGHNGIDFNLSAGSAVLAAAAGRVVLADWGGCGKSVILEHRNGYRTLYLHLDPLLSVGAGQEVTEGQPVGRVGSLNCTGPHLHFGVQFASQHVDPFGYCPDFVGRDPWQVRSGAKSYWLWKFADSPCPQQNGGPRRYAALPLGQTFTTLTLARGETAHLSVRFKNTGLLVWPADGPAPVLLGTTNPLDRASPFYPTGGGQGWLKPSRVGLTTARVEPGGEATFEMTLQAPASLPDGYYVESFGLVAEGLTWFGDRPISLGLTVAGDSPSGAITPPVVVPTDPAPEREQQIKEQLGWLANPDPLIRRSAVAALTRLGATEAVPLLLDRLATDEDSAVRWGAGLALLQLGGSAQAARICATPALATQNPVCV